MRFVRADAGKKKKKKKNTSFLISSTFSIMILVFLWYQITWGLNIPQVNKWSTQTQKLQLFHQFKQGWVLGWRTHVTDHIV